MEDHKIEKYLSGLMSEEEEVLFLKEVNTNEGLKNALTTYKDMEIILDDNDWQITDFDDKNPKIKEHVNFLQSEKGKHIKEIISQEESNYFRKSSSKFTKIISITASVAAVLMVSFLLLKSPNTNLYDSYKNDWQELPSLTLRGENNSIAQLETLFNDQKYTEALALLNTYTDTNVTNNPQILMYKGVLNLELNNHQKAIASFTQLQNSNSIDAFKAHWYLALTYLKTKENKLALKELKLLTSKSKVFKHKEASSLIKELE